MKVFRKTNLLDALGWLCYYHKDSNKYPDLQYMGHKWQAPPFRQVGWSDL